MMSKMIGNRVTAVIVSSLVCLLVVWLAVGLLGGVYAFGLFLAAPFGIGLMCGLWSGIYGEPKVGQAYAQTLGSLLVVGLALIAVKMEGLICILMAAPIVIPVAVAGTALGITIARRTRSGNQTTAMLSALVLLQPGLIGLERSRTAEAPVFTVQSSIIVEAPPQAVWPHITAFPDISADREWLFRTGLAYPIRTVIHGEGVGASRQCVLSTGSVMERVDIWDPGRRLRFQVVSTPPPMHELSPWGDIHPKHLDGYYVSRQGEFTLTPLSGGRTLVQGTSWYQHHLAPAPYWRLWSDLVVRHVHRRVLLHIKELSESVARD
jgi:Polyketide cyclase / dehydrase and lipid transport